MKYAYIESGVVVEVARVNPHSIFLPSYAEKFVEVNDEVEAGWLSDGEGGFEPPVPAPQWPRFVGNAKLDLFTQSEQLAVVTATLTDPVVKLLYDRLLGAAFLTYEDLETEHGLTVLVDKGLLTEDRKAEIVQAMQPS